MPSPSLIFLLKISNFNYTGFKLNKLLMIVSAEFLRDYVVSALELENGK